MSARLRIAIVDDDGAVLRGLHRLLRAAGLDAELFTSGQVFLDSLKSRCPDCLLLDVHMPELTGLDLHALLQGAGERFPVIFITGDDKPSTRAQCLAIGAANVLHKPLDETRLLAAIEAAIGIQTPTL